MSRHNIAILCIASLVFSQACATEDSTSHRPMTGGEVTAEAGLGLWSVLASGVYAPLKLVYATGGLVAGGLAWVFSGGNSDVAMGVVEPAVSGDYLITPDLLRDPSSIEFFGRGDRSATSAIAATHGPSRPPSAPPAVSSGPPPSMASSAPVSVADLLEKNSCSANVNLMPIQFGYGSHSLDSEGKRRLEGIPIVLARCPDSRVRMAGHADATGSSPVNLALSNERATAIRNYLVAQGVEAWRLELVAEGENNPASSNETRAGRASNRRVELALIVR